MKKSLIVLLLFMITVVISYYGAFTMEFDGSHGHLNGLSMYFLLLEISLINILLLISTVLIMSKINTNQFSITGMIFSVVSFCLALYLWKNNDYTNQSKYTMIFLPAIFFVIIAQSFSYSQFLKRKTSPKNEP